jgi:hypothetical protein
MHPRSFCPVGKRRGERHVPGGIVGTGFGKMRLRENKKYALLPESREFILLIPVMGSGEIEMRAYIKNNKRCFARVMLSGVPVSNNFFHLHQLQNIYFSLTGQSWT